MLQIHAFYISAEFEHQIILVILSTNYTVSVQDPEPLTQKISFVATLVLSQELNSTEDVFS
jgi:hypothetical protein